MKSKLHQNKQFILASLIFSIFGTGAAFALPYTPTDQELDPSCAPGATDCYVSLLNIGTSVLNATSGSILFADSSGNLAQDNSNLFFDDTNNRLGIGTNTPESALHVVGDVTANNVYTAGRTWTRVSSVISGNIDGVTYGNGLFVAVSPGTANPGTRVITSPDGVNWTARNTPSNNQWRGVTYGNGLFVAVANTGSGDRVMTSPDGINWTVRSSASNNNWHGITYGNGLFVATSTSGSGDRVMTSPDGINWTSRTSAADNSWRRVTYGNGLFVAVATDCSASANQCVMTSPDGITWTLRSTPTGTDGWADVVYGKGKFVATGTSYGSSPSNGSRAMTSSDGVNWTLSTTPVDNDWSGVTYGDGLFVAVSPINAIANDYGVMTSPDGITWTARTAPSGVAWYAVAYGNGVFVSTSYSGGSNRVMYSGTARINQISANNIYQGGLFSMGNLGVGTISPTAQFNVLGPSSSNSQERLEFGGTGRLAIYRRNSGQGVRVFRVNGTYDTPTPVLNTEELGFFSAGGYDGSNYRSNLSITAVAAEDFSPSAQAATAFFNKTMLGSGTSGRTFMYVDANNRTGFSSQNNSNVLTGTLPSTLYVKGEGATSSTYTAQFHNSTGTNNALVIRDDGNIGFGVADPLYSFHLAKTTSIDAVFNSTLATGRTTIYLDNDLARGIRLESFGSTATGTYMGGLISKAGSSLLRTNSGSLIINGTNTEAVYIGSGTALNTMFDNTNNRVGIGLNGPSYRLDIFQDSASTYATRIFHDGNNDNRWGLLIQAGADTPSANKWIQFNDGDGTDQGSICYTGGQANICAPSDIRLKQNITDTTLSLNTLLDIKVKDFTYISDSTNTTIHGFIAQELNEVYPSAVSVPHDESTDFYRVSYAQLTPLIIKSIQEINANFTSLDASKEGTLGAMLKEFFDTVAVKITELTTKKLRIDGEVCVDEVCISKEQFKQIILQTNTGSDNSTPVEDDSDQIDQSDSEDESENIEPDQNPEPEPEVIEEEPEQTEAGE